MASADQRMTRRAKLNVEARTRNEHFADGASLSGNHSHEGKSDAELVGIMRQHPVGSRQRNDAENALYKSQSGR